MHVRQAGGQVAAVTVDDHSVTRLRRCGARITDPYNAIILNNDALIGRDGTAGRVNDVHVFKNYSPVRCGFVK